MSAREINFDGLVGPTHNYGGLSAGNIASMASGGDVSNPQAAALQGLEKMRHLMAAGLDQSLLPPHERPFVPALRALGFTGSDGAIVEAAAARDPSLLRNVSSASAMWTANAATVSPSADTEDRRVHFTPANLTALYHRSIEHPLTARVLKTYFPDETHFAHHPAIAPSGTMGDEGAANHGRLCAAHGERGVELFTDGRSAFDKLEGWRFLPRQARQASEAIARHHLVTDNTVYLRQSKTAIEAGAFHNDVVAVANGPVLFYHEDAYDGFDQSWAEVQNKADAVGFEPQALCVLRDQVSLDDAITSYLFNSQLITMPDGTMMLVLPKEAEETDSTRIYVQEAIAGNGPIAAATYLDLKQSMRNGGGPACLRLRVVLTAEERAAMGGPGLLTAEKLDTVEAWVKRHYRDRMAPEDLCDPALLMEVRTALDELTDILALGAIYDFQQA